MTFADTIKTGKSSVLVENDEYDNESSPYLLATLSISLNGDNGKVWTTAKNDFTLFPSTVKVILQLYWSYTYCEDYSQMTLAGINSTEDLNMGNTITVEAFTGGQEKFWMARMRYKENSGSWKDKIISARYSADGKYIGIS